MKKYICHPIRLVAGIFSVLLFLIVAIVYLTIGYYVAAVVFGALLVLYCLFNKDAFCIVTMDRSGVTKYLLGIRMLCHYEWEEIQEAGVAFCNVTKRLEKKKNVSKCSIYFSPRKMDSEQRLKACVNWPADVIELGYSEERLRETVLLCEKKLVLFNVSAQELFGKSAIQFDLIAEEVRY